MIMQLDPADPAVMLDPVATYAAARADSPVATMEVPGLGTLWIVTRHEHARMVLTDPRFRLSRASYAMRPQGLPDTPNLGEIDGPDHTRLRKFAAPAFTARRAAEFRPRIERTVHELLDGLKPPADLLRDFAHPMPIEVICDVVGIAEAERPMWRRVGVAVVSGQGQAFQEAIPEVIAGAKAAVARRRAEPGDDLLTDLTRSEASDDELVVLVWHLVLAGQVPGNLIANAVEALLRHPGQMALLKENPELMPRAVEELLRWCTPQLLTVPRFTTEDVEIGGVPIPKGEQVTVSMLSVNRDPAVFPDPDRLDVTRTPGSFGHLAFAHGAHFCLGAALARIETEVALTALINRFPGLRLDGDPVRTPDPGNWRLADLGVTW
ncbi:cytochrome P450 107B1 [Kutzneria sp. 744]|nr:cytochrome P450 [Kutzneria sp. 744]EWM17326.1 cytochrome P450 107B1 [Kutzneria sp. 744]